ncbi:TetR/AcrR family transcriptional regulator [Blastococcus sp. URHD0036]|uniref:TetR/AcrR family transcriptional regulator n=1 Tax=Blastococcus sp. URHD0036 TaxID=1380356 RepID=UPI000AAE8132|nr:TetR/AcrR family transcriptional regulator [Blastococcus sp. URHD0036]
MTDAQGTADRPVDIRPGGRVRMERSAASRQLILATAERLFAERGVAAVSHRHISEAAGQRNSAAVGYHFGTKPDLVLAILRSHSEPIEARRQEMVEALGPDPDLRDWVACLVCPSTDHLAELGDPTWFARFRALVVTDPALRELALDDSARSGALRRVVEGLRECVRQLPEAVYEERRAMEVQLLVHGCADRERALAEGRPTPRATWQEAATGIVDAVVGLWLAPVSQHGDPV